MFLIQVGGFGSFSGMATLNISTDPCTSGDDPLEDNDSCATATDLSLSGSNVFEPNLFVSKFDKDHYAFTVAAGATVQIELLFDNSLGDIDAFLREASSPDCGSGNGANELASGFSSDDNESFSWRNTSLTCAEVVLEVNVYDDPSNRQLQRLRSICSKHEPVQHRHAKPIDSVIPTIPIRPGFPPP